MTADDGAITVELHRVTTRLETMPLSKIVPEVAELVRSAAEQIVTLTPDRNRPSEAPMPMLGPTALAAQLRVCVQDYVKARTAASEDTAVAQILIDLRRNLP